MNLYPLFDKNQISYTGKYKHYTYFLVYHSYSQYTCGYVVIKPNQKSYRMHNEYNLANKIDCHGGITFDEYAKNKDRVIGYDTAHGLDYWKGNGLIGMHHLHKWTRPELIKQCKHIIDQLVTPKCIVPF